MANRARAAVVVAARRFAAPKAAAAKSTSATPPAPELMEPYPRAVQAMHWAMGAGVLTCFGTVQAKNYISDKKMKGTLMLWHKSTALIVLALLPVRFAMRLTQQIPKPPAGHFIEQFAGRIAHVGLYAGMTAMPATGVAMGYYGGKGLPFFDLFTIPGATEKNGEIAKQAFKLHKQIGLAFEYLFLAHLGAVGLHWFKGQNVLARMYSSVPTK